ncbi:MAG: hypothetical protein ACREPQ_12425 [Rhodanobacter sp.]
MNFLKFLVVLVVAAGAYHWWQKHHAAQAESGAMAAMSRKGTGFVSMQRPMGARTDAVLIFAPPNCPSETAQRARALARGLEELSIPHVRLDGASFDIDGSDQEVMTRFKRVMEGNGPPVFVRNKAKANPSLDEVVAEYNARRGQ